MQNKFQWYRKFLLFSSISPTFFCAHKLHPYSLHTHHYNFITIVPCNSILNQKGGRKMIKTNKNFTHVASFTIALYFFMWIKVTVQDFLFVSEVLFFSISYRADMLVTNSFSSVYLGMSVSSWILCN